MLTVCTLLSSALQNPFGVLFSIISHTTHAYNLTPWATVGAKNDLL